MQYLVLMKIKEFYRNSIQILNSPDYSGNPFFRFFLNEKKRLKRKAGIAFAKTPKPFASKKFKILPYLIVILNLFVSIDHFFNQSMANNIFVIEVNNPNSFYVFKY